MINKLNCFLLGICAFVISFGFSQSSIGIVNYQGVMNQKHVTTFLEELESKKDIPMHIKQSVVEMYVNATPDDFILNFRKGESYYYHVPALEESYNVGSKAGTNPFYVSGDTIVESSISLGALAYNPLDWKITNKTKKIGDYVCFKALAKDKIITRNGQFKYNDVVAWFTPEIPLSFGPKNFVGLPGLVLEVENDVFTIRATKVNLSPNEDKIKIKSIDKNTKVISQEVAGERIKDLWETRKKEYGR